MIAKKELGQNWLADSDSLLAVTKAANLSEGDFVLEIGPGLGYLTDKIVKQGANVLALELDQDLLPRLNDKYAYLEKARFRVEQGDIRDYPLDKLKQPYKICANIPYYLTANLFRILTDTSNKPQAVGLLVQKEVALRVAASVKRSKLAVIVQANYEVSLGKVVEASLFEPPPKVDSQVLSLILKAESLVGENDWQEFTSLLSVAYASPRKTLKSNLQATLTKEEAEALVLITGLDAKVRAEKLTNSDWLELFKNYTGQK